MSVQIVMDGTNGAQNIDRSRQATNQSNLQDAIDVWTSIIQLNSESHANKEQKDVIKTIKSRLKKNADYYGAQDFSAVKKMIIAYLNADPWLQINFCKDSTRQGVDEQVQREMLNHFVNSGQFKKAPPGLYVYEGKIWQKEEILRAKNQKKLDIKDIDTIGVIGDKQVFVFQKYTKVAGGHQDNVYAESLHFIREFNRYAEENNDQYFLVAQLDGEWLEEQVPSLRESITIHDRVFVGNSDQVIEWLNKLR
jgi:hypothetical protein